MTPEDEDRSCSHGARTALYRGFAGRADGPAPGIPALAACGGHPIIRVVYLVSTLPRAGPTAQLLNILRHLDRGRFEPVIVTLSPERADTMLGQFEELGIPVRSLALSRLRALAHRGWRANVERLAGWPLSARCVVHSHGVRGDVIAARHLPGVPRVATARNYPYDDYPLKFGRVAGRWMAWSHLRALRALPNVVACSATIAQRLRAHGIEASVIRNGVDTAAFHPATPAERTALRAALGLPATARVAVSVGALSARKDPGIIVRAVRSIDDPELAMVFLGSGTQESECRRAAEGDSRIRFLGQVADVARHLRSADFLVSASHSEGLPNAVLEAMACGLRVVLSDIGPHRELLELSPSSGELFAAGDLPALVASVRRAAGEAATNSPAARDGLEALLGARRMSDDYQALYQRLAAQAAGG